MAEYFRMVQKIKIFSLGEGAATVEFGAVISLEINERVLRLAKFFAKNPFRGLIEIVPAYSSLTVFFDVVIVRKTFPEFPMAFAAVENLIANALQTASEIEQIEPRTIEIPICFDAEFALDLESVAAENNLTADDVCGIFVRPIYRVFMLGFLPAFAYMGEIDERITVSRKQTPRFKIPAGSVGLAGRQTGIYPHQSPGGWQIVGRTPLRLFVPEKTPPTLLRPADNVKFYRIERDEFFKQTAAND